MFAKTSVVVFIVIVSLGVAAGVSHAEQFSLQSLQGGWGLNADGQLFTGPGVRVPAAAVGQINFDGNGNCSETAKLNVNGQVFSLTTASPGGSCTYTVNADGTGTILVSFGGPPFVADFVIVDSKKEFRFIVYNPPPATSTTPGGFDGGTVAAGVAKRQ